ncbi:putative CCR4-associated factor 1 homolog 8 [Zingiber officinale]|uniref:putative CCR4-associated factor 1 homolog 8 n=1 Tax=Zingiber officinale TaxID=94328 RepID=UPI001C4CEC0B|nr:putative CCR4-associated factor 1 homolog 8 [Zingiber officinale]
MSNVVEQSLVIEDLLRYFPIVAIDTEFPGFLRDTPRHASDEQHYADVKHNVDGTSIIQFGLALFDASGNQPWPGCCWQFNFADFDPDLSASSPNSIRLLQESGHDLHKNRRNGIKSTQCYSLLRHKLFRGHNAKYITFHGLYDVAYLMKVLTAGRPLPDTLPEFLFEAGNIFGELYDLKHVARSCPGLLGGELGLTKLARLVELRGRLERTQRPLKAEGVAHQAGFDSMVIGLVFTEMKKRWEIEKAQFVMVLYGVEKACVEFKIKASIERAQRLSSLPPLLQWLPPVHGVVNYHPPANDATISVEQTTIPQLQLPQSSSVVVNYSSPVLLPASAPPFNPVQPVQYYFHSWPYPMQFMHYFA